MQLSHPSRRKENPPLKPFRLDIVSTYRAPLYGFAILWIVIYHATIDNVDFSFGIE